MQFSDEILMAYADGELDAQMRRTIEAALANDPALADRIEQHRSLRAELSAAFDGVLDEPVPQRLLDAATAKPPGDPRVAEIAATRAARAPSQRRWSWPEWTAIAASLLIGVFAGRAVLQAPGPGLVAADEQGLIAGSALAQALSSRLSSERHEDARIEVGLSFRSRSGTYCRTFVAAAGLAGLACREEDLWRVRTLTEAEPAAAGSAGTYRMAASALPPAVLAAVQDAIAGEALDAQQEAAARERDWRP